MPTVVDVQRCSSVRSSLLLQLVVTACRITIVLSWYARNSRYDASFLLVCGCCGERVILRRALSEGKREAIVYPVCVSNTNDNEHYEEAACYYLPWKGHWVHAEESAESPWFLCSHPFFSSS